MEPNEYYQCLLAQRYQISTADREQIPAVMLDDAARFQHTHIRMQYAWLDVHLARLTAYVAAHVTGKPASPRKFCLLADRQQTDAGAIDLTKLDAKTEKGLWLLAFGISGKQEAPPNG